MKTRIETLKNKYKIPKLYLYVVILSVLGLLLTGSKPVYALSGTAISTVTVTNATPSAGDQITATITIDVSGVAAPDNALGSYTGTLNWNAAVLSYHSDSGAPPAGFTGSVNTGNTGSGQISFNGANAIGATGSTIVLNIVFNVIGTGSSTLDLEFSAMAAASTFTSLLPILTVNDALVTSSGSAGAISYLGDIGSASNNSSGTSLQISLTSAVGTGNTIIVGFASRGASTYNQPTVADDAGNIYRLASVAVTYTHGRSYIYYAHVDNALTSGQHITITTSSVESRVAVASVFSGLATINPLDQALGNPTLESQSTQQGNNPVVGPTGTTTQDNELLIGMIGTEESTDAGTGTWGNSFTAGPQQKTSGASYEWRVSMGYRIVSSKGQFTASKTVTNNPYWAAAIATFKTEDILPSSDYNVLLSRPTNNSINLNTIINQSGDIFFEYGTASGNYTSGQTGTAAATADIPVNVVMNGLSTDTKYYYRLRFKPSGSSVWISGEEKSFHTQRAGNESFTFTVTSDSHFGDTFSGNTAARYEQTMENVAVDNSDFHLDLGDAFIMDNVNNQTQANSIYEAQRAYFGKFSEKTPVFIAIGNHENEEGWNFDDTPVSKALMSIIARKQYFPNPLPGSFYTGNTDLLAAIGGNEFREDYYSWQWGDALFIVLDPFQYTMTIPYSNVTGSGQDNDEVVSGDQWNWTLGQQQYNWLKQTLENSNARYKFVFSHHVVGGQLTVSNSSAGPPTYVRGGAMAANYFEWGGKNADETDGFASQRPLWEGDPIHQLMIENGVTAFFHGHDHQFVHEEIDGIVYQLVPAAGMTGKGFDLYASSPYVMTENSILGNLSNSGHLRITVNPDHATLEYVRSNEDNGTVAYSYSMDPNQIIEPTITLTSPNGENWQAGSGHNITWITDGTVGNVHIEYSVNNGSNWADIVASTANTGSYSWTIPNAVSANCKVRISETDGSPSDISDAVFTISAVPQITVTSPNGGEHWQVGSSHNITWTSVETAGNIHIEYSVNNGGAWADVTPSSANTGSFTWTIPNEISSNCLVRISETDGSPSDISDAVFAISAVPELTVTTPNGGEDWKAGTNHNVTWTSVETSGFVHLEYSADNGSTWADITASTIDDGTYSWTVPNMPSSECLVRISDTDGSPSDISDTQFTISIETGQHFIPVWGGNGLDHMNFYALSAQLDGIDLQPGDEIGIFDGNICVGVGVLTEVLNGGKYLEIRASRDDQETPETDGYTSGHSATFKLWKVSDQKEITANQVTYENDLQGNPYTNIFNPGASCWYHINWISNVTQEVPLLNGWNIFSLNVTPENISMLQILQPLIDAGNLVKVQDEGGNAIEVIPGTSTWLDNIGNWRNTEGYKIRVNSTTALNVDGVLITNPVDIDLLSGWNIISYPVTSYIDALQVLDAIITSGSLVKVQNESGNAIEIIPGTSNWMNNIGDFEPGEGYKVRVAANDMLEIDPSWSGSKGAKGLYVTKETATHFQPDWSGNGLDHMNIYISDITDGSSVLQPGDEIGIFDGSRCVGAGVISNKEDKFYSFVASADDPTTTQTDGFIKGHQLSFKLWRPSEKYEGSLENIKYYTGSDQIFEPMGTAAIKSYTIKLGTGNDIDLTSSLGDNYPNPFTHETTIPFTVGVSSTVDISIFNMLGKKLSTLVHANFEPGTYKTTWKGTDESSNKVNSGIYFCKMIVANKMFVKTIVMK